MRKLVLLVFIISLHSTFISCSDNEETTQPITTDISITSSVSTVTWTDSNDLTQKLESVLSYSYGSALVSETEKQQTFNADTTQVNASIGFKTGFQNEYIDTNPSNNSVTITLIKEIEPPSPESVELNADGPGGTYDLITSVLAPGHNPIEVPDCNHAAFGDHIDEIFDNELNTNVFQFYIHVSPDNDRCISFDRQRNEIKTYGQSPDNLLGVENETVVYKWKFKLKSGFQSSPNFTHIHQLKSVGGSLESMPMYTLTTRKGSPDKLQLRYAETDNQVTVSETELAPLIDTWVEVTETIKYGTSGTYEIEIKNVSNGTILFDYSNPSIINWRPGATFVRPKWGIYRSLINEQDLRDETVLFADFSITEI
ncbi:heparin lyase I family protein [Winogradskyella sp. R77965]|uniref:heparin lyase I family protein n=1 Tax=Winogradskyella sp. R77965 TaxID=3093872 RepID=UPI0037DC565B